MTASLGEDHRYRLDGRIATGGMGEVWRATDTVLGREVAVKVLKNEYADDPTFRSRFEAEARHAAALHHPGVASVFDFGNVPARDGSGSTQPYLVMELVPGEPLSSLLRGNEPMPPDTAADLLAQAATAIAAAHAMGIVHRDVKPANLLVTPDGRVKITDFGIARAADTMALTSTGEVIGTPHYLSPEQATGEQATAASDIYSLGVVLYECLAGRRPFEGDTPVITALAHLREPVPELPDSVPDPLREATYKALAKDPQDRFSSAGDLADALRGAPVSPAGAAAAAGAAGAAATQVLTPGTQVLSPAAAPPGSPDRKRRFPFAWWPMAAAALAVLLLIALVTMLVSGDPEREPANTAADNPSRSASVPQEDPTPAEEDPAPADDRIRVPEGQYVGRDAEEVTDELEGLGFDVREEKVEATSEDQEKDTVASVTPNGLVQPEETITLGVYEEFKPPNDDGGNDGDEGDEKPGKGEGRNSGKAEGND